MKKVLYLFDALKRGGAETSTLEIAKRFKNWVPVMVCIYEGTELRNDFEEAGIKVYSLDIKEKFGIAIAMKKIQEIQEIEKPDVIHANLFMAEQFSRWLGPKNKIPVINSFVNDSYSRERYELLNFKQKLVLNLYKAADRYSANKVSKFMSLTQAIIPNNTKALNIEPKAVVVIPRGRNIIAFRDKVNLDTVNTIKEKYGNGPLILTVSRLLIRKGYMEAINAIDLVVKKYPDVKYLIAGKGHDESKIRTLIKELNLKNNVFLLGSRDDVPSLLEAADIFLFPSHYEGQGGALIEAMLMEKKIIATRIPVLEESVKDNLSAKLFDYRNVKDMADKIMWAIENPDKMNKLASMAKKEAEQRFSIEEIAEKHEKLYDEVLNNFQGSLV
jgi:glycosyltransferase involved in cell wall biosynthesis